VEPFVFAFFAKENHRMKIQPHELNSQGYELIETLGHQDIIPFIRVYMKKKNVYPYLYNWSNILFAAVAVFWFWKCEGRENYTTLEGFNHFSYGLGMAFLLIPIHEYIHALAYRLQGATQTSYDANLKKFYFMAMADQFVASRREFQIVALAPVVVITFVISLFLVFANMYWTFTLLGTLLLHTLFTSGDFALLSYFEFHKDKEVVTYDDKANKISYFYARKV
jgi:Putative zincin peptidase